MEQQQDKPWWTYAPYFPKEAIIILALAADLIIPGTWAINFFYRADYPTSDLPPLLDAIISRNPMVNLTSLLALLQLNLEVYDMILNRKRVYVEKMEAVAAAEAKAKAETEARVKARLKERLQEWYDANQEQLTNVPPPPGLDYEAAANTNGDRH